MGSKSPPSASNTFSLTCGRSSTPISKATSRCSQMAAAGTVSLIKSYLKPNDSVKLVFNQQQKAIQSIQVASYLTDPRDAVTIAVQFTKLPDGTNHVATNQVNGVSKQLGVSIQNSTYQPI
jgi:hypothetical protein